MLSGWMLVAAEEAVDGLIDVVQVRRLGTHEREVEDHRRKRYTYRLRRTMDVIPGI